MNNIIIENFKDVEMTVYETEDGKKNIVLDRIKVREIGKSEIKSMSICINNIDKKDFTFLVTK